MPVATWILRVAAITLLAFPSGAAFAAAFGPPTAYPLGAIPAAAAIADLNHDGEMDLVLTDLGNKFSVLLGNGDGTFQPPTTYPAGSKPRFLVGLAVADFNEDGELDIVAGMAFDGPGGVVLLLGNGDGTFQPPIYDKFVLSPLTITVADFNHDNHLDLWTGSEVLLGNGDSTFQAPRIHAGGYTAAVGDLNNDGNPDLISADSFSVMIRLGNGDGTFQPASSVSLGGFSGIPKIAVGDLNADGNVDLAVTLSQSHALIVLLGNGDGTFQNPLSTYGGQAPNGVHIADINGDAKPDIIVADTGTAAKGGLVIVLGNGDGTFQFPSLFLARGANPVELAIGPLNSDKKPDIVFANSKAKNALVLLNTNAH